VEGLETAVSLPPPVLPTGTTYRTHNILLTHDGFCSEMHQSLSLDVNPAVSEMIDSVFLELHCPGFDNFLLQLLKLSMLLAGSFVMFQSLTFMQTTSSPAKPAR
jgi:hypothetical protein